MSKHSQPQVLHAQRLGAGAGAGAALRPGRVRGSNWLKAAALTALVLGLGLPVAQGASEPDQRDLVQVDAQTERVIQGALRWLAARQQPNGSWGSTGEEARHPVAMTGYVLIAFLATGNLPNEGPFGKTVAAGARYLLDSISPEGYIGNRDDGQYMYGHGIASIALAELYGQTRHPAIRAKLERVIKLIVAAQSREGGWRYRPVAYDADISVTVLQVVALRAAKNAGLDVPQRTIDQAVRYVKACYHERTGGFSYQPHGEPGFARTAAAIYSLQVCGLYDDPMVKRGSAYLFDRAHKRPDWFTYGHFYAAPAQYMIGGDTWARWYGMIKEQLLSAVSERGDQVWWDQGRFGDSRSVGPVWATAIYTTILAMPYHYLPLYQR
jgi:hypothetical protein